MNPAVLRQLSQWQCGYGMIVWNGHNNGCWSVECEHAGQAIRTTRPTEQRVVSRDQRLQGIFCPRPDPAEAHSCNAHPLLVRSREQDGEIGSSLGSQIRGFDAAQGLPGDGEEVVSIDGCGQRYVSQNGLDFACCTEGAAQI
ncbi:MAG: hypothetical protein P8N28_01125 [Phycisphaerales bacterium]|nr:hypothetical protein [Phycisphaerales bacterium]